MGCERPVAAGHEKRTVKSHRQALLALHGAVALFGCAGLLGKVVACPAIVITCVRSLVAAVALGGLLAARRQLRVHTQNTRGVGSAVALALGGALLAVHWWSFFAAIQLGTVALGLLTFASYPLFGTLLEPLFFRERLRLTDGVACLGVAVGLALVVPDWNFGNTAGRAAIWGILSGLTFALLSLLNRRLTRALPPLRIVAVQTALAGLLLLPFAGPQLRAVTPVDWVWLVVLGVVFTGLAHWGFTASLTRLPVRLAGVTAALEPVYGIALAWALLGEAIAPRMLAGGVSIIAATCLATLARQTNTPVAAPA